MLLRIGIGDAYGAGFEFSVQEKIDRYNDVTSYYAHDLGIPAGNYTDDTQMSLAIAELLIDNAEWTPDTIAQKFVDCFKRDERLGYSKTFYHFLQSIDNGEQFLNRMRPTSSKNGAAMRSAPLGYIADIDVLLAMTKLQASLTHNTEIGIKSAQAVALMAHYYIYNQGSKDRLTEFVSQYTQHNWNDDWSRPVACCGEETVNALLTVLKKSISLKELLFRSVQFTGDVDTVAAVGLGVAHLSESHDAALPEFLFNNLENGPYGKAYLKKVSEELHKLIE